MNLYIVRHADAVTVGGDIQSDFDRTLSDRGRAEATMMARALAHFDIDIRSIITSPLVRAVETGKIFGEELKREPETSALLEPGFNPRHLFQGILERSQGGGVVAIGHQPDMSMFISHLISPSYEAAATMDTAAIACVAVQPAGPSQLRWLLTPEIVKSLNFSI